MSYEVTAFIGPPASLTVELTGGSEGPWDLTTVTSVLLKIMRRDGTWETLTAPSIVSATASTIVVDHPYERDVDMIEVGTFRALIELVISPTASIPGEEFTITVKDRPPL